MIFSFVTLTTWLTLFLIGKVTAIRVSEQDEKLGLNFTEHGESVGSARLQHAIDTRISDHTNFSSPLDVASNDEHSELAASMNELLEKHEQIQEQVRLSEKRFINFAQTASNWLWETDENLQLSFFNANSTDSEHVNQDLSLIHI